MRRQSRQSRLIVHDQLPGVRRIQHVFGIFLRHLRQLTLQRLDPCAFLQRQVRARLPEISDGLIQKSAMDSREPATRRRLRDGAQTQPEFRVERNLGKKSGHLGQHRVVRLPQFGAVGDRLQMGHFRPGDRQFLGRAFEREERVVIRELGNLARPDGRDAGLGVRDTRLDVRPDMFGRELGPTDVKGWIEKRMGSHGQADTRTPHPDGRKRCSALPHAMRSCYHAYATSPETCRREAGTAGTSW